MISVCVLIIKHRTGCHFAFSVFYLSILVEYFITLLHTLMMIIPDMFIFHSLMMVMPDSATQDPVAELQKLGGAKVLMATVPDSKTMTELYVSLA